jgi:hypothetical protein
VSNFAQDDTGFGGGADRQQQRQRQKMQMRGAIRLRCSRSAASNFVQDDVRFEEIRVDEKTAATTKADSCGMTNKRTSNATSAARQRQRKWQIHKGKSNASSWEFSRRLLNHSMD